MEKLQLCSAPMSRRTLLHGVACAVAVGATAERALAAGKASQSSVAYQDSPKGGQRCDNCSMFQPPNACKTVDGVVSPSGWCKIYVKK
ncbi:MAG: high-potential iron-sulfur protein [Roseiarcus sp.]